MEAPVLEPLELAPVRAGEPVGEEQLRRMLSALGEDPYREGLLETPRRAWESLKFLTSGYEQSAYEAVGNALFAAESDDLVLVKDIRLFSLCEHHLLPFTGVVHIAYIPNGRIIGLSKLPRLVNVYARRLQVQERLTHQVARALMEIARPQGVVVRVEASHLCMAMRGVQETASRTVTESVTGSFRDDPALYSRFQHLMINQASGPVAGLG